MNSQVAKIVKNKRGAALLYTIIALTVIALVCVSVTLIATSFNKTTTTTVAKQQAFLLAKSIGQCFASAMADSTSNTSFFELVSALEETDADGNRKHDSILATASFRTALESLPQTDENKELLNAINMSNVAIRFRLTNSFLYGDVTVTYNGASETVSVMFTFEDDNKTENMLSLFRDYNIYTTAPGGMSFEFSSEELTPEDLAAGREYPSIYLYNGEDVAEPYYISNDVAASLTSTGKLHLIGTNTTTLYSIFGTVASYGELEISSLTLRNDLFANGDVTLNPGVTVVGKGGASGHIYAQNDVNISAKIGEHVVDEIKAKGKVSMTNGEVGTITAGDSVILQNCTVKGDLKANGTVTLINSKVLGKVYAGELHCLNATIGSSVFVNAGTGLTATTGDAVFVHTDTSSTAYNYGQTKVGGNLTVANLSANGSMSFNAGIIVQGGVKDPTDSLAVRNLLRHAYSDEEMRSIYKPTVYPYQTVIKHGLDVRGSVDFKTATDNYKVNYLISLYVKKSSSGASNHMSGVVLLKDSTPLFTSASHTPQYRALTAPGYYGGTVDSGHTATNRATIIDGGIYWTTNSTHSDMALWQKGTADWQDFFGYEQNKHINFVDYADKINDDFHRSPYIHLNGATINNISTARNNETFGSLALYGGTVKGNIDAHHVRLHAVKLGDGNQRINAHTVSSKEGWLAIFAHTTAAANTTADANTALFQCAGTINATGDVGIGHGMTVNGSIWANGRVYIAGTVKGAVIVGNAADLYTSGWRLYVAATAQLLGTESRVDVHGDVTVRAPSTTHTKHIASVGGKVKLYGTGTAKTLDFLWLVDGATCETGLEYAADYHSVGAAAMPVYIEGVNTVYSTSGKEAGVYSEEPTSILFVNSSLVVTGDVITKGRIVVAPGSTLRVMGSLACADILCLSEEVNPDFDSLQAALADQSQPHLISRLTVEGDCAVTGCLHVDSDSDGYCNVCSVNLPTGVLNMALAAQSSFTVTSCSIMGDLYFGVAPSVELYRQNLAASLLAPNSVVRCQESKLSTASAYLHANALIAHQSSAISATVLLNGVSSGECGACQGAALYGPCATCGRCFGSTHVDMNYNGVCDTCGYCLARCDDNNFDGLCDGCGKQFSLVIDGSYCYGAIYVAASTTTTAVYPAVLIDGGAEVSKHLYAPKASVLIFGSSSVLYSSKASSSAYQYVLSARRIDMDETCLIGHSTNGGARIGITGVIGTEANLVFTDSASNVFSNKIKSILVDTAIVYLYTNENAKNKSKVLGEESFLDILARDYMPLDSATAPHTGSAYAAVTLYPTLPNSGASGFLASKNLDTIPPKGGDSLSISVKSYESALAQSMAQFTVQDFSITAPTFEEKEMDLGSEEYWNSRAVAYNWVFPNKDGNAANTILGLESNDPTESHIQLNKNANNQMSVSYYRLGDLDIGPAPSGWDIGAWVDYISAVFSKWTEREFASVTSWAGLGFDGNEDAHYYRVSAENYASAMKAQRKNADILVVSRESAMTDMLSYLNWLSQKTPEEEKGWLEKLRDSVIKNIISKIGALENVPYGSVYRPVGMFFFESGYVPAAAVSAYTQPYNGLNTPYTTSPARGSHDRTSSYAKEVDEDGCWRWGDAMGFDGMQSDCTWTFFTCEDPAKPYESKAKDLHIVLPKHTYLSWSKDKDNTVNIIGNGRVFLYLQEDTHIKVTGNGLADWLHEGMDNILDDTWLDKFTTNNKYSVFGGVRYVAVDKNTEATHYDSNGNPYLDADAVAYASNPSNNAYVQLQPRMYIVGTGPNITFQVEDFQTAAYVYMPNGSEYENASTYEGGGYTHFIVSTSNTSGSGQSDVYGMYVADKFSYRGAANTCMNYVRTSPDLSDTVFKYNGGNAYQATIYNKEHNGGYYHLYEFWDYPDNLPLSNMSWYYYGVEVN
ncbi:MAG: polymer-forming cytoskeletal protein [Clostridia bacterium]|nr:polymer-forming cytoskeletal protein [Clostridia bacterium]